MLNAPGRDWMYLPACLITRESHCWFVNLQLIGGIFDFCELAVVAFNNPEVILNEYHLVNDVHCILDDTDDDIFRNGYSLMDGRWLHCWNASDYMGKGINVKMQKIYGLLEEKLK